MTPNERRLLGIETTLPMLAKRRLRQMAKGLPKKACRFEPFVKCVAALVARPHVSVHARALNDVKLTIEQRVDLRTELLAGNQVLTPFFVLFF